MGRCLEFKSQQGLFMLWSWSLNADTLMRMVPQLAFSMLVDDLFITEASGSRLRGSFPAISSGLQVHVHVHRHHFFPSAAVPMLK